MTTTPPRKTFEELKVIADDFLKNHRFGILATGKRDGSPQQSILGYRFDGTNILIQTGDDTAKVKNLRKRPGASLDQVAAPRRDAVIQHHVWGRSFKEIAASAGIAETAAKLRSSRGMAQLRALLSGAPQARKALQSPKALQAPKAPRR